MIAMISFSIAGAAALGDTVFIRPGQCAAQETYLLAVNSAAIIRRETPEKGVIVYREQDRHGWASRHLLRRFDLSIEGAGLTIVNSGEICRSSQ
ncbi:hypothetical protein [Hyphococcus sp.]|uniref:hypothetical protein n=1 Tax=Hyphococcus sp. TaxID=2038636 RepID=UPI00375242EF